MNELDYVRDNRLRLWFLTRSEPIVTDIRRKDREALFRSLIEETSSRVAARMKPRGLFAFVIGEATRGGKTSDTAGIVIDLFEKSENLRAFVLTTRIDDRIPDIRRARRDLRGTKRETILIFQRR
jgi:hypothetical protein